MRLQATKGTWMPKQSLNFTVRVVGSPSGSSAGPEGDLIGFLEHQCDCSREEGQEGAGEEVALAMGGVGWWEWKLTHLGSFAVLGGAGGCPKTQAPLTPPLP